MTPSRAEGPIVAVVDDDQLMRETLENVCRSVGLQVKSFGDVDSLERSLPREATGCLLLDMRLPRLGGVPAVARLRERFPELAIIGLSGHADARTVVRALRAGAVDFFDKPFSAQELLETVQLAIDKRLQPAWVPKNRRSIEEYRRLFNTLTRQQRVVLERYAAGESEGQIARHLSLHPRSVQRHLRKAMTVLEIGSGDLALIERIVRTS